MTGRSATSRLRRPIQRRCRTSTRSAHRLSRSNASARRSCIASCRSIRCCRNRSDRDCAGCSDLVPDAHKTGLLHETNVQQLQILCKKHRRGCCRKLENFVQQPLSLCQRDCYKRPFHRSRSPFPVIRGRLGSAFIAPAAGGSASARRTDREDRATSPLLCLSCSVTSPAGEVRRRSHG